MSADKDARIAELEQQLMELTARFNEELGGSTFMGEPVVPNTAFETDEWSHLDKQVALAKDTRVAELERKLAEQQAMFHVNMLRAWPEKSHDEIANAILSKGGSEELNNLLAKAKEDGRKEVVQVRIDLLNWLSDCGYLTQEAEALHKESMLAAPKPQGETSCQ